MLPISLKFAGENATLSCKIGSVPSSKVRWYRDGTEVLNNSLVNRGQQKFVIFEEGSFEKTSALVLTNARPEDSGPFMCVSQNQAGRVEANFTLQVCSEYYDCTGSKFPIVEMQHFLLPFGFIDFFTSSCNQVLKKKLSHLFWQKTNNSENSMQFFMFENS